jgi:hypothetical protein
LNGRDRERERNREREREREKERERERRMRKGQLVMYRKKSALNWTTDIREFFSLSLLLPFPSSSSSHSALTGFDKHI